MENFTSVVGIIMNNWSALKMAIENGFGGCGKEATDKILCLIDFLNFKLCHGLDSIDLADALESYMDNEFNTILEDDSGTEVANALSLLYQFWRTGNIESLNSYLSKLATQIPIQNTLHQVAQIKPVQEESDDEDSDEDVPTEESEWTEVRRRK